MRRNEAEEDRVASAALAWSHHDDEALRQLLLDEGVASMTADSLVRHRRTNSENVRVISYILSGEYRQRRRRGR